MRGEKAWEGLASAFNLAEEKAYREPILHLTPTPDRLRTMEIAQMFSEIEDFTRDNIAPILDSNMPTSSFCVVQGRGLSSKRSDLSKVESRPYWKVPAHRLVSDPAEYCYYELPERFAYMAARMPGKKTELLTDFTWARWRRLLTAFNWECAYCSALDDLGQDHVRAIQKGGEDLMANILPACHPCNLSKGIHSLNTWLKGRGKQFRIAAEQRIEEGKARFEKRT